MVFAAIGAGPLKGKNVHWPLHHTEERRIATRIGTEAAGSALGQRATDWTRLNLLTGFQEGLGEATDVIRIALHEIQGQPLRRTRADSRQLVQGVDQELDWLGKGRHHAGE